MDITELSESSTPATPATLSKPTITLTAEQSRANDAVASWLADKSRKPYFILHGLAGTGKTSLAKHFAEQRNSGGVVYAAYTGKAVEVLQRKGCSPAYTIHSLIYLPQNAKIKEIEELRKELSEKRSNDSLKPGEEQKIIRRIAKLNSPDFTLNEKSPLFNAKLLVLDECFVGSSMVDSPSGPRKICDIKSGDLILNAQGVDRVIATRKKEADATLIKIQAGKSTFTCSRNHPFFTVRGLVRAENLQVGDALVGVSASMRFLRAGISAENGHKSILFSNLQRALVASFSEFSGQDLYAGTECQVWRSPKEILRDGIGRSRTSAQPHWEITPDAELKNPREVECYASSNWASSENSRGKRKSATKSTGEALRTPRRKLDFRIRRQHQEEISISSSVQNRHSKSSRTNCDRAGWGVTLCENSTEARCAENEISSFARVDSVEILESRNPELDCEREADGKLYLYDLQIEQHHSFSVNGILVHNCSMVDATIARDLIAFNVPILVLGDPGQLPPIEGAGFFNQKPDFMLTEIHRQAAESPIIQLAMKAREGRGLALGNYGSSQIIKRASVNEAHVRSVSQIITGRNTSRKSMNDEMRTLLGFSGEFPQKSERLICLRNNKQSGLFNGAMVELASDSHGVWPRNPESNKVDMTGPAPPIDMMDDAIEFEVAGREGPVTVLKDTFANYDRIRAMPYGLRAQYDEFDYAYAITCHKAQGSQFPSVLIYADLFQWDKELYKRWIYTSLTRAEDRVILAL